MRKLLWLLTFWLILFTNNSLASSYYEEGDFRELFLKEFKLRAKYLRGEITLERFRFEPRDIKIPKNSPFKVEWTGTPRAGSNSAVLVFNPKGGTSQIIRLWGFIEVRMPVLILKNNLSSKSILKDEDLAFEARELSRLPHDVILNKEEALGKELRMGISAGTVLRASHLREPLLVKRNQEVEILAKGQNFEIKAKGIALENGRLDEFIRVRNKSSNRVIQAKVISEGQVEVTF